MRSELKRLMMGITYSIMTFSLILGPVPFSSISIASAQSTGSYSVMGLDETANNFHEEKDASGTYTRKKIYKKGEDFTEVREKTTLSKYSEEAGGVKAIIQQAIVGLMGITLLNAIKYKYLHEANPILYGNDCGSNKAAKYTIRAAQLGSLMYIIGDVTANFKFSKSARLAKEALEGWEPEEKKNFEKMSEDEKKAFAESKGLTLQQANAAVEQDTQLKGFNTLIDTLESKESAIKTKRGFGIAANIAYGVSAGYELVSMLMCRGKCIANLGFQKGRLSAFSTAATTAVGTATAAATAWAVCPGPCNVSSATACTAVATQVSALAARVGAEIGANEAAALARLTEAETKEATDKAASMKNLSDSKEVMKSMDPNIVGDVAKQLAGIDKILEAYEKAKEAYNTATTAVLLTKASVDQSTYGPISGSVLTCANPLVNTTTSQALRSYINYAYTKTECCGGPGLGLPMAQKSWADKKVLETTVSAIDAGVTAAMAATAQAKMSGEAISDEALAKLKQKAAEKAVLNAFGGAAIGGFGNFVQSIAGEAASVASSAFTGNGTLAIQGVPTGGMAFPKGTDIQLQPLFGGGKSSSNDYEREQKIRNELRDQFNNNKLFVKNNFEMNLRRIATHTYLKTEFKNAKNDLKFLVGQDQQINNIMFFFDQVVEESNYDSLANGGMINHRNWSTILNMVTNLVIPKANALSGMMMGGMAIRMVAPMLGLPPEWTEVLNIGSSIMAAQGLIGGFAKRWALVKPIGRTVTWTIMTTVLAFVNKWDKDALKEMKKRIKAVKKERKKWVTSSARSNNVKAGDYSTNYSASNYQSNKGGSNAAFIKQCATPSGSGFKPASCPQKTTSSAFDPGKMDPIAKKLMTPDHIKGLSTISSLSSRTANGNLDEGALSGSNLSELERMNNAIMAHNKKLQDTYDKVDKRIAKRNKAKASSLARVLASARNAMGIGPNGSIEGSAAGAFGGGGVANISGGDDEKSDDGIVTPSSSGKTASAGGGGTAAAPSFDLDLLGDDGLGGTEIEDENGVDGKVSERAEENLGDFELNHDDISKKKEVSIFKILSNRYILSYPKVLEEEEAPSEEVKN